jgi:cell division septation protein DedD
VRTASIPAAGAPARPVSAFPEPIKVKTVSVRPDGTIISASDAPAKPAAVVGTPPLLAQAPPQRTASNVTGTTPPVASPPSPPAVKPAAAAPAPVAAPAKTTARISPPSDTPAPKPAQAAAATPAVASGGFAVQLAAAGSEAEARDKYQLQFASALDGHAPGVVKGEANGKSVWRIRVGGLSREGAVSMCVGIKDTGGSCFVAAN